MPGSSFISFVRVAIAFPATALNDDHQLQEQLCVRVEYSVNEEHFGYQTATISNHRKIYWITLSHDTNPWIINFLCRDTFHNEARRTNRSNTEWHKSKKVCKQVFSTYCVYNWAHHIHN